MPFIPAHLLMVNVFTDGSSNWEFYPGSNHNKDSKKWYLLNTQHYKGMYQGKVEQSRERSSTLPYTSVS